MNQSFGSWGEQLAVDHLVGLGWQIIERNWRCPAGELDIIALEPVPGAAPIAVVVEVKARRGTGYGEPLEAITTTKLRRLRRMAAQWREHSQLDLSDLRVDAIGILKPPGQAARLTHLAGVA